MKLVRLIAVTFIVLGMFACSARKKLARAESEIQRLNTQDSLQRIKIGDYEQQITQLKGQNDRVRKDAEDCRISREMAAKRAAMLGDALGRQRASMEDIRRKAAEALNKYQQNGVDVTYKDGLVYISMQDKLVFQSASASINKTGIEALAIVASVLNDNPNTKVTVVGNTDSLKVRGGTFKDNWSLSTERANSIIRVLRDKYNIDPARLTASGRGKYDPIADNGTDIGRARNRRTDIILNPDLSQLWDMINNSQNGTK